METPNAITTRSPPAGRITGPQEPAQGRQAQKRTNHTRPLLPLREKTGGTGSGHVPSMLPAAGLRRLALLPSRGRRRRAVSFLPGDHFRGRLNGLAAVSAQHERRHWNSSAAFRQSPAPDVGHGAGRCAHRRKTQRCRRQRIPPSPNSSAVATWSAGPPEHRTLTWCSPTERCGSPVRTGDSRSPLTSQTTHDQG